MDKKIIVLSGPPGCGKDTLANYLSRDGSFCHVKFASELKVMTHRLYGISVPNAIYQFETVKDVPSEQFYGLTPRQAYISVSEQYVKPIHGMSFFGDKLVESILLTDSPNIVVSDGGLIEELIPVVDEFGSNNVMVIKIDRPSYTFDGDSRSYYDENTLQELCVFVRDLHNHGSVQEFLNAGALLIYDWLEWDK